jgi:DNA mismatch repair protein MutL
MEGYAQGLMKGCFPVAALFINVPFDQVDVNVHPTKNEVRFARQKEVHDLVKRAVGEVLRKIDQPAWGPHAFKKNISAQEQSRIAEEHAGYRSMGERALRLKNASLEAERSLPSNRQSTASSSQHATRNTQPAIQTPIWGRKPFSDLRIIGQLHHSYILCESKEALFLIDQHAAHERIAFEQLKKRSDGLKTSSQRLLLPETIDMGYLEAKMLDRLIPQFEKLGFEIEHFGGNTFVVKSVPDILSGRPIKSLIMETVENMIETGFAPGLEGAIDEFLISVACHSVIRANQALTDGEAKDLLEKLENCENPSHCPHGRPIWIKWSKRELEKSFGRIV